MSEIIVVVKRAGEARVRDLAVPDDLDADALGRLVARALHWDSDPAGQPLRYQIRVEPPGRVLRPHESLAAVGAGDGAWLVFQPQV